ncbi:hypothetical protein [Echinicola arenosa]|uniref:hypothetical protein n=1 Tax=Echinicola arenosa TaxID=2774144 RepID=UPI001CDC038D|nr:hypothetical protein [Echinicola arenosa]
MKSIPKDIPTFLSLKAVIEKLNERFFFLAFSFFLKVFDLYVLEAIILQQVPFDDQ